MISASQMRAGRALIDWSQTELATATTLAVATIRRMESLGPGRSSGDNVQAVQRALEAAGVIFIDENGEGPGVRLRKVKG